MSEYRINILPAEVRELTGATVLYDTSCNSNARVYRSDTGYFIKTDEPGELNTEYRLTELFFSAGMGPEVCGYFTLEKDWLVTREVEGSDLTHCLEDPENLCRMMAEALRKLHGMPADDVPVSRRYKRYMDAADGISEGYYDPGTLMKPYVILSREEAWQIMQEGRTLLKCDTFIHGDACLPNYMQKDGQFSKFIDVGLGGKGDRHIDLYWALWSLQYNLKTDRYGELFLDLYGRENYDEEVMKVIAAFEVYG